MKVEADKRAMETPGEKEVILVHILRSGIPSFIMVCLCAWAHGYVLKNGVGNGQ